MGNVSITGTGDMPDRVREAIEMLFGFESPTGREFNLRGAVTGFYVVVITDKEGNQYQVKLDSDILMSTIAERDNAEYHAGAIDYLNNRAAGIVREEMRNGATAVEIYRFDKAEMIKKIEPESMPDISSLTQEEWEQVIALCAKDGIKKYPNGLGGASWQRFYAERIADHYNGATEDEIFVAISEVDGNSHPVIYGEELAQALAFKFHKSPAETTTGSGVGQMTQREWKKALESARSKWCDDGHGKEPDAENRWAEWEAEYIRDNHPTKLHVDTIARVLRDTWDKFGWSWVAYAATELSALEAA